MYQRLLSGARRPNIENLTVFRPTETSNVSLSMVNPPIARKVDHHSIELIWERINDNTKGDKRLKYYLEEEDPKTHKFISVYVGYSDTYKIEGLIPVHPYKYRLRITSKESEIGISPTTTIYTKDEPYNSDHLHKATSKGDLEALSKIITSREVNIDVGDKLGYSPLMNAAQKGLIEVVDKLLIASANVSAQNSSGKNSLMLACYGGHEDIAKRLRAAGAEWSTVDRGGSTSLHWAVDGRNCKLILWMIQDGCPVDLKDHTSGWTPLLRCAALTGDESVASVLLRCGADVNATDYDGKTALMIASLNGYFNLVKTLIKHGADLYLTSKHGKNALEMAKSFDRRVVVEYLEKIHEAHKEKVRNQQLQDAKSRS